MSGHFREMRLLLLHVASAFIMKTFVLDVIQCRTFVTVLFYTESVMLSPCFIPESVFYTQSVMLSPRFIPKSVFYTQVHILYPSP